MSIARTAAPSSAYAACAAFRNTSLLSPFLLDYPSSLSHTLDDSASCIAFNPTGYFAGSFVAVGRTDGCISIWDVLTHDVVWVETGHAKQVESVSWSRNSRFLLSASRDGTAIVWDLERSARLETVRFASPVINAQFHPGNARIFVVTLATGQAVVVDLRPSSRGQRQIVDPDQAQATIDEQAQGKGKQRATDGSVAPTNLTFAHFNPSGRRLYAGTKKGELLIFDSYSHEVRLRTRRPSAAMPRIDVWATTRRRRFWIASRYPTRPSKSWPSRSRVSTSSLIRTTGRSAYFQSATATTAMKLQSPRCIGSRISSIERLGTALDARVTASTRWLAQAVRSRMTSSYGTSMTAA